MVPFSRRRLLQSVGIAAVASLAGCTGEEQRTTKTAIERPGSRPADDPPAHLLVRAPDEQPPVWLPEEGATESTPTRNHARGFVASDAAADRLAYRDVHGVEAARQFVADTDFAAETLYFQTRLARECYRLELCSVTWSSTDIHTQFGSRLRDAETACETDERDAVSVLVRLPEALDPDRISGSGSGWSSAPCGRHRRPEREETDRPQYGPAQPNATENASTEADR